MSKTYEEMYGPDKAKEIKTKLSISHLGKHHNKGHKMPASHRINTSIASKKRWQDPEYRALVLASRRQYLIDHPEAKEVMRKRMMGNHHTLGKKLSPEHNQKLSERMMGNTYLLGHVHSEESRALMSKARKGVPKSPSHAENLRKHLANIHSPTSIEIILNRKISLEYPNEEIIPEFPFGFFLYDFAIPRLKLFFEADGEYWHSFPNAKKRDKSKTTYATKRGWALYRFTGTELKQWAKENP